MNLKKFYRRLEELRSELEICLDDESLVIFIANYRIRLDKFDGLLDDLESHIEEEAKQVEENRTG